MKHANIRWRRHLKQRGVPFKQVNFIHDEWQTEIPNNKELAKYVGEIQVDALRAMTDKFNLNCAIDGETRYGYTWFETH